ncbi:tetratricopeptide repeat protein [Acidisphaera sp. S103]|uniref:tetratricopeptide repeat protein n=1 Tax=Acidisphaera sp. S103 TaxID=1747223 RepID=UPI00131C6CF1|nr:tetratricopeptide repeat-containing glycosyltransferase family protein [Acidisphaera sp. S103]
MSLYTDLLLEAAFQAHQSGRAGEAEAVLRLVIGRSGHDAHAVHFLGHLAYLRGQFDDAAWLLTHALAIDPNHARAHNDLGETLRSLGRNENALPHLQRAITLEPTLAHAYGNLAATLVALNRPEEALLWAQESLRRATDKTIAHCDLGSLFGRLNRTKEAIRQYDLALALQPGNARVHYFRSLMRLALGQMPDAWAEHEARLTLPAAMSGVRAFPGPIWTGREDLAGRTILLSTEQGFGDAIQFVRYVPMVAARGATVLLEVQRGLGTLFQSIPGVTQLFEPGDPLPHFDLHCSLMSLPAAFGTGLQAIPSTMPYLAADPALVAAWSDKLGPWQKMRIGLAWSGSLQHADDRNRSIPLSLLAPLLKRTDIACHVIQRDIHDADRQTMADFPALSDHSASLTDFAQTAALIASMDMIVSVDTAVTHLAGALNMSTWVMLAHSADWRWMRDRDDSPWYPSLRLFRQKRRGDWHTVIGQVSDNLDQWAIRRG